MRKLVAIIAASAALAACTKAEFDNPADVAKEGVTIFRGTIPSTKVEIGDLDGTVRKTLWESGDALTVLSSDGDELGTATLVEGAGTETGTFELSSSLDDGMDVTLVYGSTEIPAIQTRTSADDRSIITYATAETTVDGDGVADFTLEQKSSLVRVSVGSSELSGASLSSVIFRSIGESVSSEGDYVQLNLTTPLSLTSTAKDIYLTVRSGDFTDREIYVAFVLTRDGETFTLPVGFKGKEIKAGHVSVFNLPALSESNCAGWWEMHDTRLMPGEGYAYGDANCYMIQCKNGNTYTGATYTPNADIPDEVSIVYKARGDFRKVINPREASFTWMRLGEVDSSTGTGTGSVYVCRTANYSASAVDPTKFTFANDAESCTVKVRNESAYAGAPVLLMTLGGKVQWAWSFWNIAADGTDITPLPVKAGSSIKISPMDLGQATTQFETWIANLNGSNPDPVYRTIYRYQWGRPIPVFWNPVASLNIPGIANGNIPAVAGPLSMKESLEHPCALIVASDSETGKSISDWLDTPDGALWGNLNSTTNNVGDKSIYDPCPKGYRVADRYTLSTLRYGTTWETSSVAGYPHYTATVDDDTKIYFIKPGYYTQTTATSSGSFAVSSMGGAVTGLCIYGIWWSNLCQSDSGTPSTMANNNETTANPGVRDANSADVKTRAFSVRCQVDEDNR